MTIIYYHGAPGSYKTSSMVRDWLLKTVDDHKKAIKKAKKENKPIPTLRTIYTNIRGIQEDENILVFNNDNIIQAMFKAEHGSLFLIDEIGQVTDKFDIKKAVFDSDLVSDENGMVERIVTLPVLLDKRRHFNFDIIVAAPSIKRIPEQFRLLAEYGYKHKNLGTLGLKGLYIQGQHIGEDTGGSESHYLKKKIRWMPKRVFSFYQSTSTGKAHESPVGDAKLYKNPVILGMFLFIGVSIYFFFNMDFGISEKGEANLEGVEAVEAQIGEGVNTPKGVETIKEVPFKPVDVNYYLISDDTKTVAVRGSYTDSKRGFYVVGTCEKQVVINMDVKTQIIKRGIIYNGNLIPFGHSECPREIEETESFADGTLKNGAENLKQENPAL